MQHILLAVIALVTAWLLSNGYNADQAKYEVSPVPNPASPKFVCETGYKLARGCYWQVSPYQ